MLNKDMKFIDYDHWLNKDRLEIKNVTIKLDGVRVHVHNNKATSRAGNALYNIPTVKDGIYEFYIPDVGFDAISGLVRNKTNVIKITNKDNMYMLYPEPDLRLQLRDEYDYEELAWFNIPYCINEAYSQMLEKGYEGLVLHTKCGKYIKLKPLKTYDVLVLGIKEGKGKYKDKVGSLVTAMGNVGSGLSDKDRERKGWIGELIEVECMELTKNGRFRHPRFKRIRWDK